MARLKRHLQAAVDDKLRPTVLGELAESGVDIFCWCNRCSHRAVLPADSLIGPLGPQFPVPEIGARMRCSGCGAKDVATRPDWPSLGLVSRHS